MFLARYQQWKRIGDNEQLVTYEKTILTVCILTTSIVAAIAIVGFCKMAGKTGTYVFQSSQITQVLRQEEKSRSENFRNGLPHGTHYKDYVRDINRIDYSLCPSDFKIAWHDYVEARHANLDHPILNAFTANTPAEKYRQLENVAMRYGLTFSQTN